MLLLLRYCSSVAVAGTNVATIALWYQQQLLLRYCSSLLLLVPMLLLLQCSWLVPAGTNVATIGYCCCCCCWYQCCYYCVTVVGWCCWYQCCYYCVTVARCCAGTNVGTSCCCYSAIVATLYHCSNGCNVATS